MLTCWSEKLFRVVVRVTPPGDEFLHEYYREILRSADGTIHFARVYHAVNSDHNLVTDESAGEKPYITTELECDLKYALQRVKTFIPDHWRLDQNTSIEVFKCEPECRKAWQSITTEDDHTSDGLFPEHLRFETKET